MGATRWQGFSTDFRFTIANMTAEFGGLNGIFEADAPRRRCSLDGAAIIRRRYTSAPTKTRTYAAHHVFDLSKLAPQVAKPFSPDNVFEVDRAAGQEMHGMFIGACTTTEEELILGAMVLRKALEKGRLSKPDAPRLMVPGSREISENLRQKGLLAVYEQAGFRVGRFGLLDVPGHRQRQGG